MTNEVKGHWVMYAYQRLCGMIILANRLRSSGRIQQECLVIRVHHCSGSRRSGMAESHDLVGMAWCCHSYKSTCSNSKE